MKTFYPTRILFFALLILFGSPACRAQEILFTPRDLATAPYPITMTTGDFNGDGKPDFVVTTQDDSVKMSVLLSSSKGAYLRQDYPLKQTAGGANYFGVGVQVGDLNGDGKPDIIVLKRSVYDNVLSVFLNRGDGTFTAEREDSHQFRNVLQLVVKDINGDGKPDILLLTGDIYTFSTVTVLRGQGDATFASPDVYRLPNNTPSALLVEDFDGDGKPDLVVGSRSYDKTLAFFPNNGNGTFGARQDYDLGYFDHFSLGDVNGDGRPDLILSGDGYPGNGVSVLLNQGDGTFGERLNYPITDRYIIQLLIQDLNGDGKPDLIVTDSGYIYTLLNRGGGVFDAPRAFCTYGNSILVPCDVNSDGKPDVAVLHSFLDKITLFTGNGDGNLNTITTYPAGTSPTSLVASDVNGDEILDLVVLNYRDTVNVLLGKPDGSFEPKTTYSVPHARAFSIQFGDLNGDGKPDLVLSDFGSTSVTVLLNGGDGTFGLPASYDTGKYSHDMVVGDLDGDGNLDIVTLGSVNDQNGQPISSLNFLPGLGNGSFGASRQLPLNFNSFFFKLGDFNRDGRPDLLLFDRSSPFMCVYLNTGHFSFASPLKSPTTSRIADAAVGDLDGDGNLDLATANSGHSVSVLHGNGNGTFSPGTDYPLDSYANRIILGDMDGDGRLDIVTACNEDYIGILLNQGKNFGTVANYSAGDNSFLATGDFNRDGKLDLATVNSSGSVAILPNLASRAKVSGRLNLEGVSPHAGLRPFRFTFRTPGKPDFAPLLLISREGNYSLPLPRLSGTLHIKGPRYLAKNIPLNLGTGDAVGINVRLFTGDVDGNNRVDVNDLTQLLTVYNSTAKDLLYYTTPTADLNGDGFVNVDDLTLLLGHYNSAGDR